MVKPSYTTMIFGLWAAACSADPEVAPGDAAPLFLDGAVADVATPDLGSALDAAVLDGEAPDGSAPAPDAGFPANPLDGVGTVELVEEGFMFTEGPQWIEAIGELYFTDIPANTIYRLAPGSAAEVLRTPSGNTNGLAVGTDGLLLSAEHGGRRLARTLSSGVVETIVDRFEGDRFHSPNDIVVRSDGTIYFTDPPYGLGARPRELDFCGVFRISPAGALSAEWRGALTARPNGVALSPDESTLYVPDTEANLVRAFDVMPDGALANPRTLINGVPFPDGMAVDEAGNLFVTSSRGIDVYAPDGTRFGAIAVPRQPANCAFGGADRRTLYITAREGLYQVRLVIPGLL